MSLGFFLFEVDLCAFHLIGVNLINRPSIEGEEACVYHFSVERFICMRAAGCSFDQWGWLQMLGTQSRYLTRQGAQTEPTSHPLSGGRNLNNGGQHINTFRVDILIFESCPRTCIGIFNDLAMFFVALN